MIDVGYTTECAAGGSCLTCRQRVRATYRLEEEDLRGQACDLWKRAFQVLSSV